MFYYLSLRTLGALVLVSLSAGVLSWFGAMLAVQAKLTRPYDGEQFFGITFIALFVILAPRAWRWAGRWINLAAQRDAGDQRQPSRPQPL